MKKFKRIMALVIALAMVLSMSAMTAFATDTNAVQFDGEVYTDGLKVTGLENGDTVKYYKIIEWIDSEGWAFTEDFAGLAGSGLESGQVVGATAQEILTANTNRTDASSADAFGKNVLKYITGYPSEVTTAANGTVTSSNNAISGRINSVLAGKIAEIANGITDTTKYGTGSAPDGTWKQAIEKEDAGLYLVIAKGANPGVVYNPIFVAADFDQKAETGVGDTQFGPSQWDLVDLKDSYSNEAIAKKNLISVDKKTTDNDQNTNTQTTGLAETTTGSGTTTDAANPADFGEYVQFTVVTTVPAYASNYTDPVFTISDKLTTGLVLAKDSTDHKFEVKAKAANDNSATYADVAATAYATGQGVSDIADAADSFTIGFSEDYLHGLTSPMTVQITYWAKITDAIGKENVSTANNTVTVEYSNDPTQASSHGILKDVTNHYTFAIDADIFGSKEYNTSELIKIGVDKDGYPVTEEHTYSNGTTTSPLQGAKFSLFKSLEEANKVWGTGGVAKGTPDADSYYKNYKADGTVDFDGTEFSSKADGTFDIYGLDVGTYYLVERTAPSGYIADQKVHTIDISAKFDEREITETIDGQTVKYKTKVLTEYTIDIDGVKSIYTVNNGTDTNFANADVATQKASTSFVLQSTDDHTIDSTSDNSFLIANTRGTALPSTGGIGTTIFYTIGAILVIGAGVILITRRRMDA